MENENYDYEYFKACIKKKCGICLDLYKEKQMKRRIDTLIARKGLKGYKEYLELLDLHPYEMEAFKDYITINVTEFFRTGEHWKNFEDEVLKRLAGNIKGEKLKIWSCACSTGEEPYSVAMSLTKISDLKNVNIIASDIDERVLDQAQAGIYDERSILTVPEDYREKFFEKDGTSWYISNKICACVEFEKLDLLQDKFPQNCDIIVCRNVLIYFTEEAKDRIYAQFFDSLNPGGYLFTGNTEQIIYYKRFGFKKVCGYLYQKP